MDALGSEALARQFFSLHSREAATAIDAVRPSLLQEAHVVRSGPAMLYRWQKLFKHLEQPRCCLHILVLGGSVACGSFSSLFGRRKGVTPATFNTTYAVHLERYLNSHRSSCCQESHLVENRCFPGAGSSYINSNFERVVEEPPLRARRQWDLIIVDVGPNDFNAFVLDDLRRGHGMNGMQASIVEWETEALIRRISTMQHPVPVMFMENAWFDSARCSEPFGAFNVHLPVLKHYGVPTLHMIGPLARICGANETTPSASRQTAAVQVGNRTSSTPAELCRSRMLADALHLSAQGHLIGAFFLVNVLILERLRSGLNRVSTRDLPSPLASIADLEDLIMAPSTLLDFSNPAGRWIEAITKINGWQWRVDRKLPSGMYEHVNFSAGERLLAGDKLGLVAVAPKASIEANLVFKNGTLRVGYLTTPERTRKGATIRITLLPQQRQNWHPMHLASREVLLNSDWNLNVSIYRAVNFHFAPSNFHDGPEASIRDWRPRPVRFELLTGKSFKLYTIKSV